jgi:hypothetical protein
MEYDSKVWDKLDIHSRTEMDQKGLYPRYRALMKKKFPKPMSRKTMMALENENFHSAYEAIGYK